MDDIRKVNIRTLKAKLSAEMKDLPFAITNNGRVVGYVVEELDYVPETGLPPEECSHQKKAKKAKKVVKQPIMEAWLNPLANTLLAPKG